jgi:23S rRNA (pseudouridine1915-N3)-methyltransferase
VRIRVVTIGRKPEAPVVALVDDYTARLKAMGVVVDWANLPPGPATAAPAVVMVDEAKRIAARLAGGAGAVRPALVSLEPNGKPLSSEAFAAWIGARRDAGQAVDFVIGGAFGLAPEVGQGAALRLSLGPMVLAHRVALVVLAEQVYRAFTILAGKPYHKA